MTRRHLPTLSDAQREGMNPSLLEPIEYRKSGLSLNHVVGCPLVLSVISRLGLMRGFIAAGQGPWHASLHVHRRCGARDGLSV